MPTLNEPKIRKKRVPWKDCEHLFTPANIVKYELACCRDCLYRKHSAIRKTRALRRGPVIWIVREGKPVDMQ